MIRAATNWLVHIDIAIANLDVVSTRRVGAHPRLVMDRRTTGTEIRQRHQIPRLAFLAFWQRRFHLNTPPNPQSDRFPQPAESIIAKARAGNTATRENPLCYLDSYCGHFYTDLQRYRDAILNV